MRTMSAFLLAALFLVGSLSAQDDFKRERNEKTGPAKNALEGKTPPPLKVSDWINSKGIKLADLKGKVVVLDFWGTW